MEVRPGPRHSPARALRSCCPAPVARLCLCSAPGAGPEPPPGQARPSARLRGPGAEGTDAQTRLGMSWFGPASPFPETAFAQRQAPGPHRRSRERHSGEDTSFLGSVRRATLQPLLRRGGGCPTRATPKGLFWPHRPRAAPRPAVGGERRKTTQVTCVEKPGPDRFPAALFLLHAWAPAAGDTSAPPLDRTAAWACHRVW